MRGHLVKHSKDSWSIVLDIGREPTTGKRRQQWISVKGTRKDAERRLTELLAEVDGGSFVRPAKASVGDFIAQWLDTYAASQVRPRTLEVYRQRAKHLIAGLGHIPLSDLRPGHLQRYYASKSESLSGGTLVNPNPPMRSGLGVGTRGEGRGTRRSALDSDKWGRWRPLVGVGGADGGPGQRRWGGVGGTACKGRQSRTGPVRLCGVVE